MREGNRLKRLRRDTKPNSRELAAAVSLKYRASVLSSRTLYFDAEKIRSSYFNLFSKTYDAVALDYDGTLVSLTSRRSEPSRRLIERLGEILDSGIYLAIISGRGQSLLQLKRSLSRFNQERLFIAMYNGSKIVMGSGGRTILDRRVSLKSVFSSLRKNLDLAACVKDWSLKPYSIQVVPRKKSRVFMDGLCKRVGLLLPSGLSAKNSGFAIDVYPAKMTKDHCLAFIRRAVRRNLQFLRIADQGHELGNDYELLDSTGGLTVGTVSAATRGCFPVLSRRGKRFLGPSGVTYALADLFQTIG